VVSHEPGSVQRVAAGIDSYREDAMLVRALEFEGFIENPDWVYRWRDQEWGAKGVSHFYKPDRPVAPSRHVMDHILDRLGIDPEIRDAWCESHADEAIVQEFLGDFPRSTPEAFRNRRVFRVSVGVMWDRGLYRSFREKVREPVGRERGQ